MTKVWQRSGSNGYAGWIGRELVVAGDDPDFAAAFDADLRRAEDVSGGMEGNGNFSEADGSAVGFGLDCGVVTDAGAEEGF